MGFTSKQALVPTAILSLIFVGTGAYLTADIYDKAPGILTNKPKFGANLASVTVTSETSLKQAGTGLEPILNTLSPELNSPWIFGKDEEKPEGYLDGPSRKAPIPSKETVHQLLTNLQAAANATNTGVRYGVIVKDTATGEELGQLGADIPMTPASTSKIIAATTATLNLDPQHQFPTVTYQANGKLYLKGFGDQMLALGQGNPSAINGHAGLTDLAQETVLAWRKANKLSKSAALPTVDLFFDDSAFGEQKPIPDWAAAGNTQYETIPTPLAMYTGLQNPQWHSVYHNDPASVTALAFKDQLVAAGMPIGQVARHQVPAKAKELAQVKSAPLHEIEFLTLKNSDNMLADLMCRAATVHSGLTGSFPNQIKLAQKTLEQMGLAGKDFQNQDCSGLSTKNLIPPRLLAQVLEKSTGAAQSALHTLPSALPRSGLDGTLKERFLKTPAQGRIWAKTGSLSNSRALAGFLITTKGRVLTFTIIADSYAPGNGHIALQLMDQFLVSLVES